MNTKKYYNETVKTLGIFRSKGLLTVITIIALFNFLSTKVLPKDIFLVFAADIDANQLVVLANMERSSRGLDSLTIDSRLVNAAYAKGQDMLDKDYWAHYGPNGESPWQFILVSGYDYVYAGENLAKDFSSAAPIHSAWMASPSHRSNLLNSNFENIGIAAVTGEFQGEETTIVVQMFGATRMSEYVIEGDSYNNVEGAGSDSIQPPITGEEELEVPVITEPIDGEILNEAAFSVRGKAREGSYIEVFDNQESVGTTEISEAAFDFRKESAYEDGGHSLYSVAEDDSGKKSGPSNVVEITVDTIAPLINEDSLTVKYIEISSGFKRYALSIEVEDNPTIVKGEYRDEPVVFTYVDDKWQCILQEGNDDFADLVIIVTDVAGNSSEEIFEGSKIQEIVDEASEGIEGYRDLGKWVIEDIFSRILTRSLRGQINFFIIIIMMALLTFEWLVLARTGFTKEKSSSLLHLGVFAILLFVGLLGGGGEIL